MSTDPRRDCYVAIEPANQTEAEWLAERLTGIGGSDAPRVLGLSGSRYELWAEKSGLIEAPDLSDLEWIEWGHRLEAPIAEAFAERTGRSVHLWPQYTITRNSDYPWLFCTPDARQYVDTGSSGLLQIKTANAFLTKEWEDEPPLPYQVQLQHELMATGFNWGTLAVLIGGQKLRWFDMEANAKFAASLFRQEQEFWRRVKEGDPPPVDGSAGTAAALKKLYPIDNGESVALPPEASEWDTRLTETKLKLKQLESTKRLLENQMKTAIGNATVGIMLDGTAYSYKSQTTNTPAKEARTSTFRVLRRMKTK